MFFVCAINNGCTADLGDFSSVSIERPTTDLIASYHVFDEENAGVEPQWQFVKQL